MTNETIRAILCEVFSSACTFDNAEVSADPEVTAPILKVYCALTTEPVLASIACAMATQELSATIAQARANIAQLGVIGYGECFTD